MTLVKDWNTNELKLFMIEFEDGTYNFETVPLYLKNFKTTLEKYDYEKEVHKRWHPTSYEYNNFELRSKIEILAELVYN